MPLAGRKSITEVTTSESSASGSGESDPESMASSSEEEDSDDDCDETELNANANDEQQEPTCVFCENVRLPHADLFLHLKTEHKLNIFDLRTKFRMDQESYVKLINFLRTEFNPVTSGREKIDGIVERVMSCKSPLWDRDEFLKPVVEEDPLLTYWFECDSDDEQEEQESRGEKSSQCKQSSDSNSNQAAKTSIPNDVANNSPSQSQQQQQKQLGNVAQYEEALSEALEKIETMKSVMSRIVLDNETLSAKQILKNRIRNSEFDSDYFASYDDVDIHNTMLSDTRRTEAYEEAILKNEADFKNKIVLDVGCGTSILSMFSAKAGASKVFAVDRSKIIEKAILIVRENNLENTIQCIQGSVETIRLPVPQVDIIISEFMGYFLLYEGMLFSVIEARKKFLKPGGSLYPNTSEIFIQGISDMDKYQKTLTMWDDVYGFKMSCFKEGQFSQPTIETVNVDKLVSEPVSVLSLDLMTCENDDVIFEQAFSFKVTKTCQMTGICGYFDVGFSMGSSFTNILSTAPTVPSTHWYQTVFPFKTPISVQEGADVKGVFGCRPNARNPRWLDFTVTIADQTYTYTMK